MLAVATTQGRTRRGDSAEERRRRARARARGDGGDARPGGGLALRALQAAQGRLGSGLRLGVGLHLHVAPVVDGGLLQVRELLVEQGQVVDELAALGVDAQRRLQPVDGGAVVAFLVEGPRLVVQRHRFLRGAPARGATGASRFGVSAGRRAEPPSCSRRALGGADRPRASATAASAARPRSSEAPYRGCDMRPSYDSAAAAPGAPRRAGEAASGSLRGTGPRRRRAASCTMRPG